MARDLLVRGMIAGALAAILVALFAHFVAEPQVDLAIAFEAARAKAAGLPDEPELVSRATQRGIGLFTAVTLYGAAVGGIFALVFAATYGRLAQIGPRSLAVLLALAAFVAIAVVPALKYPPNPPAVGAPETITFRTETYFLMLGCSLAALVAAIQTARTLYPRLGAFNAMLVAAGCYIVAIVIVELALPAINEVPATFPATVLWNFRVDALAMQALLWSTIGLAFGSLAERRLRRA